MQKVRNGEIIWKTEKLFEFFLRFGDGSTGEKIKPVLEWPLLIFLGEFFPLFSAKSAKMQSRQQNRSRKSIACTMHATDTKRSQSRHSTVGFRAA